MQNCCSAAKDRESRLSGLLVSYSGQQNSFGMHPKLLTTYPTLQDR